MKPKPKDPRLIIKEYIKQAKVTAYRVSKETNIHTGRISEILKSKRRLTAHVALKLAKYFGCNGEDWLRMQMEAELKAELKKERIKLKEQLAKIKPLKMDTAK